VWFDNIGRFIQYQVVGGRIITIPDLDTWIGSSTINIVTWYDQSVGAKDITQAGESSQPLFVNDTGTGSLNGFTARFSGSQTLTGPNMFSTTSVRNIQIITQLRERVQLNNAGINLGQIILHIPWSDSNWYFNTLDYAVVGNRRAYTTNAPVALGSVARVNAFRVAGAQDTLNVNTTTINSTYTSGEIATSSTLGATFSIGSGYNGHFQYFITLSAKTTDANAATLFATLSSGSTKPVITTNYAGATLIPDGRVVLSPSGANNVATVSGFPSVPIERCLHPCFNKF
jgi:hypothetical protein